MPKQYYNTNNNGGNRQAKPQNKTPLDATFYNPYTFIPLSDKVYTLSADEQKALTHCHDIPFQDGVSGEIEITFQAKTPLCIRNSHEENVKMGNEYYIPATSIKGMIRNVFEIITLSNIRNGMENKRCTMSEVKIEDKIGCSGFLIEKRGKYYIIPCKSDVYTYEEIQEYEDVWIKNKSTSDKYNSLKDGYIFETEDDNWCMWFFSNAIKNQRHEYLFTIPEIQEANLVALEKQEYQDFISINQKQETGWKFWKDKICNYDSIEAISLDNYKGIIPCFFRTKQNKENKTIVKDLGLSFLYRQKTLHDCLGSCCEKNGIDLAQAVFGYTSEKNALKGRIQFTNTCIPDAKVEKKQTFILDSPKPTYYPFYLKQDKSHTLNTYSSTNATIAGWKRPLVHREAKNGELPHSKLTTSFIPLSAGCKFKVIIKIHNLRRYELGALLAAITFCNHKECFHSLGFAKVMGYGKLQLIGLQWNIINNDSQTGNLTVNDLIDIFKKKLFDSTGMKEEEWNNYCKPLFTIASGQYIIPKPICYPDLNEFKNIKYQKKSLKDFSPKIS